MKRLTVFFAFLLFVGVLPAQGPPQAQIEFVAQLESSRTTGNITILELQLTPQFSIQTRVTPATQIRDENDARISVDQLSIGDTLKVEGFFAEAGILAREIEITSDSREFELKGTLDMVNQPGRMIFLLGFPVEVPPGAEIEDTAGNPLSFADLRVGQFVKVEGMASGGALVARQVKVGNPAPDFARIRVRGTVLELGPSTLLVEIAGSRTVLIEITPSTAISGILTVGAAVEVEGRLTPRLAVEALRIEVQQMARLVPDEVRLDLNQRTRVDILLASSPASDAVIELASRNSALVQVSPATLRIPAGALLASFDVMSGGSEGTTFVDVSLPSELGSRLTLKVEVETDLPDDNPGAELVEVKWNPRKIESGPTGVRQVQVTLNRAAPQNLVISLSLKEGQPGTVDFPSQVMIAAGARSAPVEIRINRLGERTKIRAQLPASVGGDTDDLDIDLRGQQSVLRRLRWQPDDLELAPGAQATVDLVLDQPAPFGFDVPIVVRDGNPSLANGIPEMVSFETGQRSVRLTVQAGTSEGRVRYQATLPFQLGGESDELKVEIKD